MSMLLSLLLLLLCYTTRTHAQRSYHLWSSQEIHTTIQQLGIDYPQFVRVTTSQDAFGLPAAGNNDCPFDSGTTGCRNYYAVLQDYAVHPEGSASAARLPAVLLSGALHGDERVGPTTVMETMTLLLQAAACEATTDSSCRSAWVAQHGLSHAQRQWLARLVTTRRIVLVPTANALGYYRNTRTEGSYDPNRDFPFDATSTNTCMQTVAGRTLNELFLDNIFQLCFTFHAGIELIGYEWGAFPYLNNGSISPDDVAQEQLSTSLAKYGGSWAGTPTYETGPSNVLLYAVHGGMEDWAYAGSWETQYVRPCTPTSYGGYPASKTQYNGATLRAFNLLVETSDLKTPLSSTLGEHDNVLAARTAGHVARNIRLSMAAIDLVEPYAAIQSIDQLELVDDIVPGLIRDDCVDIPHIAVPSSMDSVSISWTVGGSVSIDETQLWIASAADVDDEMLNNCFLQPDTDGIQSSFVPVGGAQSGSGFFSPSGAQPSSNGLVGPRFSTVVDLASLSQGSNEFYIIASARVDSDWSSTASNGSPGSIPPQAHMANVRTNPNWYHESAGKIVQGRLHWFSLPIHILRSSEENEVMHINSRGAPAPPPTLAPAPTSPPRLESDASSPVLCFSGETTITTGDGDLVRMKDLSLGETIQTWSGEEGTPAAFEPVYSFGHYHPDMVGEFLQIQPSNLELSKHHLIFSYSSTGGDGRFVPAGMLEVGDNIILVGGKAVRVTSIQIVQRRGVYAPFTPSGTLYVNGVLVSSFVALDLKVDSAYLTLGSIATPWTHHWIAHSFETVHRTYCRYVGRCATERYTDEGLSTWIALPFRGFLLLQAQYLWVQATIVLVLLISHAIGGNRSIHNKSGLSVS